MKKLLCLYNGNVVEIYQDGNKYYYTNSKGVKKELQRNDFIFIG